MPSRTKILPSVVTDNEDVKTPTEPGAIEALVRERFEAVIAEARGGDETTFFDFEKRLVVLVRDLGRLLVVLFLAVREERVRAKTPSEIVKAGVRYRRRPAVARNLSTLFGVVRYARIYLRRVGGGGFHPLDAELGLTADRISMGLVALSVRLATMMSYVRVQAMLMWFIGQSPSTEVIQKAALGLGRRTAEWFERAPAPDGDGEVLIIQIDSKGAPTATETELSRRRQPRKAKTRTSARHRGRDSRARYGSKPRRKKGDKSKNARMATLVIMYTLKRGDDGLLHGPINKRAYASFAPKRHAFAVARREADKRGFHRGSGRQTQLLTDGDLDLQTYADEFFPEALHTIDVMHVVEKLHTAADCLYREGSDEERAFVEHLKEQLYGGQEASIVSELRERLARIPPTGPGNKGKRQRLHDVITYIDKRVDRMNYKRLIDEDLEIGSGAVEGAVKNLIGARFDFGGSRWIRERAEALLQLRCIEANGDWDAFIRWVHDDHRKTASTSGTRIRVQQNSPSPLPILGLAA